MSRQAESAAYFTDSAEVRRVIRELKESRGDQQISDIVDAEGHQYVDLVLEGGGVLGIALVGYVYALEQMGVRFLRIGGTSAGSIVALLLAAEGPPAAAKAKRIVEHLANVDLYSFVDGDDDAQDFVDSMMTKANKYIKLFKGLQVRDNINRDLGLLMGKVFADWLNQTLSQAGITTTQELEDRIRTLPEGLRERCGKPMNLKDADPYLAVIAADVTTQTKVEFPKMAGLYWAEPEKVNPAKFVRASMSIPFFFQPMRIRDIPSGQPAWDLWRELVGYTEEIPKSCTLVDGGTMSNFPIDIFHDQGGGAPTAPTFGARLKATARRQEVENPEQLLFGVFNAARHTLDYDFILRNPDYKQLVASIDIAGHDWLNFRMGVEEKKRLFTRGVQAASEFYYRFDWEKYKKLRAATPPVAEAPAGAETSDT